MKIYLGQEMDQWLDDDKHLERWEDNTLSASDRRVLLACWYTAAVKRALEGEAKLEYFQHAGALLTADGTDDELIKFEGVPDEGVPDEGVPDQVKSTVSNLSCLCAL